MYSRFVARPRGPTGGSRVFPCGLGRLGLLLGLVLGRVLLVLVRAVQLLAFALLVGAARFGLAGAALALLFRFLRQVDDRRHELGAVDRARVHLRQKQK